MYNNKPFYTLLAPQRNLEDQIDNDLETGSVTYETVQIGQEQVAFIQNESQKMFNIMCVLITLFILVGTGFLIALYYGKTILTWF